MTSFPDGAPQHDAKASRLRELRHDFSTSFDQPLPRALIYATVAFGTAAAIGFPVIGATLAAGHVGAGLVRMYRERRQAPALERAPAERPQLSSLNATEMPAARPGSSLPSPSLAPVKLGYKGNVLEQIGGKVEIGQDGIERLVM